MWFIFTTAIMPIYMYVDIQRLYAHNYYQFIIYLHTYINIYYENLEYGKNFERVLSFFLAY